MPAMLLPEFAITRSRQGAAATFELRGELDSAVASDVIAEFDNLLASDPAVVIVDLHELDFMDASGTHALEALRTRCEEQGRRFVLVRGQPKVHRLLTLCGVERRFELVDSIAEALERTGVTNGSPTPTAAKLRAHSAGVDGTGLTTSRIAPAVED